jgi:hypothetical protein
MSKKEAKPFPIVDLAGDVVEDLDTEIITLNRRLYRVRKDVKDTEPPDFSPWQFDIALVERYCEICGFELAHAENFSKFMEPKDCRCVVHCGPDEDSERRVPRVPRCTFCGEEMTCSQVFEVPLHQVRYVWICEAKHSHVISQSREGI